MFTRKSVALIFLLILTAAAQAADVAMVISGSATARLESDSWQVQIAEMLPENVYLTVSPAGILRLMHFANDQEYDIPAQAQIKVTADNIEGSNIEGKPIKLVSGKLLVGKEMQQQTGAAFSDRNLVAKPKSMRPKLILPEREEKKIENLNFNEYRSDDEFDDEAGHGTRPPETLRTQQANVPHTPPAPQESDSNLIQGIAANDKMLPATVSFAVPHPVYESFSKTGADFHFVNQHQASILTVASEFNWVKFVCESPDKIISDFEGTFLKTEGKFVVKLLNQPELEIKFASARKLEVEGYLCQAAAMWLELADKYQLSERVLQMHLDRLQKKICEN